MRTDREHIRYLIDPLLSKHGGQLHVDFGRLPVGANAAMRRLVTLTRHACIAASDLFLTNLGNASQVEAYGRVLENGSIVVELH